VKTHRTEFDKTKDREIHNSHIFRSKKKEIFDFQTKNVTVLLAESKRKKEEEERETLVFKHKWRKQVYLKTL